MDKPTKAVRILASNVHDGLGGVHLKGQVVAFEIELADFLIARGQAEQVARSEVKAAEQVATRQKEIRDASEIQAQAQRRMALYDHLPPDVRSAAAEHGDDVIQAYIKAIEDELRDKQGVRQMERIPDDAGFEAYEGNEYEEPEPTPEPVKRKKRRRPRKSPQP